MTQLSKPKLLVTILNQGWIRPELADAQVQMLSDARADTTVVHMNMRPSENARNQSVKDMLDGGYDYLLTIDHDTCPQRNPLDLIELDLDVVGFAYLGARRNANNLLEVAFLGMDKQENGEYLDHKDTNGLQEVDAVGSGCLLMSRKVLESVSEPFVRKWKDGFAVTGLDFYFCEKAKEKGFKVYCHYGYIASHYHEVDLLDFIK